MHRGWIIGDFEPSILRTKEFEVAILFHPKGEEWPAHYHAQSVEYNVLLEGKMIMNGFTIEKDTVFVIKKNEVARPEFLEDCRVLCIKVPSLPGDKYEVV